GSFLPPPKPRPPIKTPVFSTSDELLYFFSGIIIRWIFPPYCPTTPTAFSPEGFTQTPLQRAIVQLGRSVGGPEMLSPEDVPNFNPNHLPKSWWGRNSKEAGASVGLHRSRAEFQTPPLATNSGTGDSSFFLSTPSLVE
ncbi:hypothetical protein JTE90_020430, partial [Oedothorax gibbosus]